MKGVTVISVLGLLCIAYSSGRNEARLLELQNELQELDKIHQLLHEGGKYADETEARKWLDRYNREALKHGNKYTKIDWAYMTNITDETSQQLENASVEESQWDREQQLEAKKYNEYSMLFYDYSIQRMLAILSVSASDPLPHDIDKVRRIAQLSTQLSTLYSTTTVEKDGQTYTVEPDLETIMATSRDYDELLWAWQSWRDAVGPQMRPLYEEYVQLQNEGAQENGYADIGEFWRQSSYETDNIEDMTEKLFNQIKPMYELLHAYVRDRLREHYPEANISATGPIPAHLLGNMWAQSWDSLADMVSPYPEISTFDVTSELQRQEYTARQMFEKADEFFTSLGLEPMTDTFWKKAMIVQPTDGRKVDCHGSAEDFYKKDDFRIKMCTNINMDDLQTVHHEMGHVQYFMQYSDQPYVFRQGANTAFHEAVGDTIALSVMTPGHLQAIGLLNSSGSSDPNTQYQRDIKFLFKMALEKVAFLPFGYLIDKWRWHVFRGDINETNYNAKWWEYRLKYQGIIPPVPRTEEHFDPGAKYHVPANVPYIRYFLSFLGQFQFHKALCNARGDQGPIHMCDIYRSKDAGRLLKSMLKLGRSQPWPETMMTMTGQKHFDASAIIDYFRPLTQWLKGQTNPDTLGWQN